MQGKINSQMNPCNDTVAFIVQTHVIFMQKPATVTMGHDDMWSGH